MTLRELYDHLAENYTEGCNPNFLIVNFSDKGSIHTYVDFYEKYFNKMIQQPVKLLEIGIMSGGSLHLWQKYFKNYILMGVDLAKCWYKHRPFQTELENDPNIKLFFGVDSRRSCVPEEIKTNKFNYIIDDGNHNVKSQIATIKNYWDYLEFGGTYFIEDVLGDRHAKLLIKELELFSKEKFTYEIYRGDLNRPDDRIIAITKLD